MTASLLIESEFSTHRLFDTFFPFYGIVSALCFNRLCTAGIEFIGIFALICFKHAVSSNRVFTLYTNGYNVRQIADTL